MTRRVRLTIAAALAASVALTPHGPVASRGAEACGPYALDFAFVRVASPEDPGAYLEGRLGIVHPSFRLPWLVAAWRHLDGQPLTAGERRALTEPDTGGVSVPPGTLFGTRRWLKARADALREPEQARYIDTAAFDAASGAYFENCSEQAFEAAAATLQARIASLGAGDPAIREWVAAQDLVWANCGHARDAAPRIPAELPATATAPARADRAYQIATAHFYGGQWAEALARFRAIAADGSSPWQPWGEYLAGRTLLRQGTLSHDTGVDRAALQAAIEAFRRVAADERSPLRESAAGLARFATLRAAPATLRPDVIARLTAPRDGTTLLEDLAEYRYLFLRDQPADDAPRAAARPGADPMTDWIDTLRSASPDALAHAVARWRDGQRLPWLVAALMRLTPGHADEAALVAAARNVPATSPAWPSLAFHRARLLIRAGRLDEARALAAEMEKASAGWPLSASNQLRAVQLRLATSFEGFLNAAMQVPLGFASEDGEDVGGGIGTSTPLALSDDALDVLNERVPLARLIAASRYVGWPASLRANARLAALSRALLIDDVQALAGLAPDVRQMDAALGADLDAVRNAATAEERRRAAMLLLARRPGVRPFLTGGERRSTVDWSQTPPTVTPDPLTAIEGLRDNWWCGLTPSPAAGGGGTYQAYQPGMYARTGARLDAMTASLYENAAVVPTPSFLTAEEQARAAREWQALDAVVEAPDYFARQALAWVAARPDDKRVAEALHLAVRATRYGCTTDATGDLSRQAFTALHRRFPGSEWAKKTPYWFR
jgi:hypothetical protein